MSEFDAKAYVAGWDRIVGPLMLAFIVLAIIAVFALNRVTNPECHTNEMIYCGEPAADHHHSADAEHH